ncbi:hypothetical protein THAR02_09855 [Trichoderma harzianum]|uniref:Uncharacterized protein n=1 Tax=Trichoderma harzianum TaxID=5544 RepID=A0A0F9ZY68_TRIHA|nr:hypothetical protein THAR02_09855 [Trichoderma harzianum]
MRETQREPQIDQFEDDSPNTFSGAFFGAFPSGAFPSASSGAPSIASPGASSGAPSRASSGAFPNMYRQPSASTSNATNPSSNPTFLQSRPPPVTAQSLLIDHHRVLHAMLERQNDLESDIQTLQDLRAR